MEKQPVEMVFCPQLGVRVDLRQGFRHCIEANQCFSDDPCPFSQRFHQPPAQPDGAASAGAPAGPPGP